MKTSRIGEVLVLLSLTLAAVILEATFTEVWATPGNTASASSSTGSLLTANVPPECLQLDKNIRKATRLSTILDAEHNGVIGPSSPNGVYLDDKTPQELGRIETEPGGKLYVPDSPIDLKARTIVVAGTFQVGYTGMPDRHPQSWQQGHFPIYRQTSRERRPHRR